MNNILTLFNGILEDNSGGFSSTRALMLIWGGGTFFVWAFGSILNFWHGNTQFVPIPNEVITVLLGITGWKTVQRFGEKAEEKKT